ncbi:addiction module antidote protein [Sphaerotilus sp.]|uniref:addiction module antidote protein n=1 Tax=Sphaerotilus sp. TaxID=2093942 RepID=UPI00286D7238|nr:addiction module antidote protein [Sphaerotilus sp.]
MQTQPIQSEADLQDAFKRLEAIFQAEEGTPEFAEMQALATRIEVYERTHHPISTASASDAIRFRIEQRTAALDRQAEYLTAALRDADPSVFLAAVRDVARARGMAQVAKDAGLSRYALYRALRETSNPSFATVLKIVTALGIRLHAGTA